MKLTEQQYITLASVVEAADGLELTDSLALLVQQPMPIEMSMMID